MADLEQLVQLLAATQQPSSANAAYEHIQALECVFSPFSRRHMNRRGLLSCQAPFQPRRLALRRSRAESVANRVIRTISPSAPRFGHLTRPTPRPSSLLIKTGPTTSRSTCRASQRCWRRIRCPRARGSSLACSSRTCSRRACVLSGMPGSAGAAVPPPRLWLKSAPLTLPASSPACVAPSLRPTAHCDRYTRGNSIHACIRAW